MPHSALLKRVLRMAELISTPDECNWLTLNRDVLALTEQELTLINQLLEEAS